VQAIAGRPDASGQQFDHVGIVGGWVAGGLTSDFW